MATTCGSGIVEMEAPSSAHRRQRSWEQVTAMNKLVLTLLVIPLIIVMAAKDPQGAGNLVQWVITMGAKLLNGVAAILGGLLGSPQG